jgi:hypothetical protein
MNYRDLQNNAVRYQTSLRDQAIESQGVQAVIRRPKSEDTEDFYGDPVSVYGPREVIFLIPNYSQYYQVVDLMGTDVEIELPLEAIAKVHDYIPNDSLILLGVRNDEGRLEMTWWRVLSSQVKHMERRMSKIVRMTPVREPIEEFNRDAHVNSVSRMIVNATRIPS